MVSRTAAATRSERSPEGGIYVQPGGIAVTREAENFTSVLGSCVAVCLRDRAGSAAGMAHYLLPHGSSSGAARLRYANHAIPELIARVRELANDSARLEAKLVGGASVLSGLTGTRRQLGMNNVEAARQHLAEARIEIVAEIVGGEVGRRVIYQTRDGSLWVRGLGRNADGR